ncbi:MAG: UbiD family decarboxylase, partial [Chloroflexi bacterium]|nr:UbiD family decarboxylase [Chloroflexota bacterium]
DDDIDPSNTSDVIWALGTRCDPEDDIDILRGCWSNRLEPALPPEKKDSGDFTMSSAIIDACRPYHWIAKFPKVIQTSPEFMGQVKKKWQGSLE